MLDQKAAFSGDAGQVGLENCNALLSGDTDVLERQI
jgi:hypothetical protein